MGKTTRAWGLTLLLALGMCVAGLRAAAPPAVYDKDAVRKVIVGYEALLNDDKQFALDSLGAAMRLDPSSAYLKVLYAEALFALGRHEEIFKTLKPLVDRGDSINVQALRMLAVSCQATGRNEEAVAWFRRLLERQPEEEWARRRLLDLLNGLGRYQEMIPVYRVLLDPESENYAFDCYQMGALYMRVGGREPARQYLEEALAADSSLADAHNLLARLDELELKYAQALDHYLKFLEQKPEAAESVMPQVVAVALRAAYPAYSGDSTAGNGAWPTLLERLDARQAEGDTLNPALKRVYAIALEATGKTDRAVENYSAILAEEPNDRFTRRSLLRVLFSQGKYAEMIPLYEPLLTADNSNLSRDLFQVGVLHLRTGDQAKARDYMARTVAEDSTFAEPYRVLGNLCETGGDWACAQKNYLRLLVLDPGATASVFDHLLTVSLRGQDLSAPTSLLESRVAAGDTSSAVREGLGRLYYHGEQLDKALGLLEPLAADSSLTDNGLYTLGFLYSRLERLPEAVQAFRTVKEHLPDFLPVYLTLSRAYYTLKDYPRALAELEAGLPRVREQDTESRREVLFSMANVYHEMADDSNTVKYLRLVLKDWPDYAPALNYLGYYYAEKGENLEEAGRLVDRALATEPENGHYIDSKGWVLFKQGRREEALKEIKSALAAMEHAEIYEHLGEIYLSLGQKAEAVAAWNRSLEMDATNNELKARLEKLKSTGN
ncbi:tetratricopeptide repeat protein [bacterium]|nr:tetratricopeptide repeat protein [bacterium]